MELLGFDGTIPVLPPVGLDGVLVEVAVPVSRAPGRSSYTVGVKTGGIGLVCLRNLVGGFSHSTNQFSPYNCYRQKRMAQGLHRQTSSRLGGT